MVQYQLQGLFVSSSLSFLTLKPGWDFVKKLLKMIFSKIKNELLDTTERNCWQADKIFKVWLKFSKDFFLDIWTKIYTVRYHDLKNYYDSSLCPKQTVLHTYMKDFLFFSLKCLYYCERFEEQRQRKDCRRGGWHDKIQNDHGEMDHWASRKSHCQQKTAGKKNISICLQQVPQKKKKKSWFSSNYFPDRLWRGVGGRTHDVQRARMI